MRIHRYHRTQKRMPRQLTAPLVATAMTVGTAQRALASETKQDVSKHKHQITSPVQTVYRNAYAGNTRLIHFNDHWQFYLGDASGAQMPTFNDASWKTVNLPHDYSIEQNYTVAGEAESGYLPGGIGWYRKIFTIDPTWRGAKRLSIHFDGVYMNAEVYCNGKKLGIHPYGYTPFSFVLPDELLTDGENVLAVKVDNQLPSSRWYSGSGIYRDVTLRVTNPVHIVPNGVTVETPDIAQKKGTVKLKTEIANDSNAMVEGFTVESQIVKKGGTDIVARVTTMAGILEVGERTIVDSQLEVINPALWNVWDRGEANLYLVRTEVKRDGQVIDACETEFGFRYFDFDVNNGFSFNGEQMKLRGVCMHHDQGALGSAAWRRAIARQVEILMEMGCNAIRVTHNPAAQLLIDICNEKGMLVVEEAFDTWSNPKNGNINDYGVYFTQKIGEENQIEGARPSMTWAEYDIKAMVSRDRNAPSIILWSLGNELFEGVDGNADITQYPQFAQNLIHWIKEIDVSRPATIGDNRKSIGDDIPGRTTAAIVREGGVIGYNYAAERQITAGHEKGWKMYGSETVSAVNSRGVYAYKGPGKNEKGEFLAANQTDDQLLTAYDKSRVDWGTVASDAWWRTIRYDYNAGEFIWTGFDYLGEPTPWNGISPGSTTNDFEVAPKSSYFGIIDTTGFPKDSYYLYQSLWNDRVNTLHILPTWNESDVEKDAEGRVEVTVYGNAPVIRLYLNDKEIGAAKAQVHESNTGKYQYQTYMAGTIPAGDNTFVEQKGHESLYATFAVPYMAGKLTAKAFQADGKTQINKTTGRSTVETTGNAKKLSVSADREQITADGNDLSYITIDVQDQNGRFVNGAEPEITLSVEGAGKLLGVDNGRQSDHTPYTNATYSAMRGKLLAIVQSTNESGSFQLTAKADGLETGSVTVQTVADSSASSKNSEIISLEYSKNYYVQVGNQPELPKKLKLTRENGESETKDVSWNTEKLDLNQAGTTQVTGVLDAETKVEVIVNITMVDTVAALKNYTTAVPVGTGSVNLPDSLPAVLPNGTLSGASFPVTWDMRLLDLQTSGIYVLTGTAHVFGQQMHPTATIRVSKPEVILSGNVAPKAAALFIEDEVQTSVLDVIRDGNKTVEQTAWDGQGEIKFRYDTAQNLAQVKLYLKGIAPSTKSVHLEWSADGTSWRKLHATRQSRKDGNLTVITDDFDLVSAVWVKLKFDEKVQLIEAELITGIPSFQVGDSACLQSLRVGTQTVDERALKSGSFVTSQTGITEKDVQAVGTDHASVTILPPHDSVIYILTESEDHRKQGIYTIKFGK